MADVAEQFFLAVDQIFEEEDAASVDYDDDFEDGEEAYFLETLAPTPFWSFHSATGTTPAAVHLSDDEAFDYGDAGLPSSFAESLESQEFRLFYGADDMGSDYLGLGLGFDETQEVLSVPQATGDEGFLLQRSVSRPPSPGELHIAQDVQGLRVFRFGTDSDSDGEGIIEEVDDPDNDVPPLLWNCLRIDEEVAANEAEEVAEEDLEWEEIDGRLDERVVINMLVGADEEEDGSTSGSGSRYIGDEFGDPELGDGDVVADLDWDFFMAMNPSDNGVGGEGSSPSPLMETDDHEVDLANTSGYEVLFGQFLDHISPVNGSPPAAKSVTQNLPSVAITEEDFANNKTLCAVCKDEMPLKEKVTQLPCSHLYHGDCILPWLGIRNTCPVCRYELPTDDLEYENWKARRGPGARTSI